MSGVPQRRRRSLALLAVAVLAVHALLLVGVAPAWIDPEDDALPMPPVLSVRSVAAPVALPPPPLAAVPAPPSMLPAPPQRTPRPRAPAASEAPLPAEAAPASAASEQPATSDAAPLAVAAARIDESTPAPVLELPTYATQLPPAGQWRYELRRGVASGEALLRWQPDPDGRYALQLEGRIAGVTVLDWASQGAIDGAGLAPERFAIRRRGRDSQAANFQRDAGKITFSGPTHELALRPGVQDRLSWMLQMAAIVQAAPQRFGAGSALTLMVVGARGGADVWRFGVEGIERLDDRMALKLVREARRPRETRVEIWLDPARAYLPMRALLTQPEGGTPFELVHLPGLPAIPGAAGSTGP